MRTALRRIGMVIVIGVLGIVLANPFNLVDGLNKLLPEWALQNRSWTFAIAAGLVVIGSAVLDPKIFGSSGQDQDRRDDKLR